MKIGPLDNKQSGIQLEQAKQAKLEQAKSASVNPGADNSALDERKRLGELADQKKQVASDRFERSNNDNLSAATARSSYSKEQIESGRLEMVKQRINDGYYDQEDIARKIVDKMIDKTDMGNDN